MMYSASKSASTVVKRQKAQSKEMMLRGSRQEMTREMIGRAKGSLLLLCARGRRHIRRESA
jgi:hypothetical protein